MENPRYDPGVDPISRLGLRNTGIPRASKDHKGWDYPLKLGTPIRAAADGVVYYTGAARGYGLVVVLKHVAPDGGVFDTRYGHMNDLLPLKANQPVKKGDIIGYVGNNGIGNGPHLHYEVRSWGPETALNNVANGKGMYSSINDATWGKVEDPGEFNYGGMSVYNARRSGGDEATTNSAGFPDSPKVTTMPSSSSSVFSPAIAAQPVPFPDVAPLAQRLTTEKYFRGYAPTPNGGPEGASALAPFESPRTGTSGPIPYLDSTKAAQQLFAKAPPSDFPAFPSWASPGGAIGPSNPQLLNGLPALPLPQKRAAPDDPAWDSAQGASPAASAFQQNVAYSPAGDFVGNFPRVSASATMPSPVALNGSESSATPRTARDFHTLGQSIARILGGASQFIGNAPVSRAEAASPSVPPIADSSAVAYFPSSNGAVRSAG